MTAFRFSLSAAVLALATAVTTPLAAQTATAPAREASIDTLLRSGFSISSVIETERYAPLYGADSLRELYLSDGRQLFVCVITVQPVDGNRSIALNDQSCGRVQR